MPVQDTHWTAAMARALPDDGNRYEVLDGELFVSPAPSRVHQRAVKELVLRLDPYVRAHDIGELGISPADIEFSARQLLQPDVFVAPERSRRWSDISSLLLAVEVTSPTTAHADRLRKRLIYQRQSVSEYWIIDLDARVVERWRPTDERPEIVTGTLTWRPRPDAPATEIDLTDFFESILR